MKIKRHGITMIYKKRNPIAQEVRTEKYKPKVVPDKHKERKEEEKWKELMEDLRRR